MTIGLRRRGVLRAMVVLLAVLAATAGQVTHPDRARAIPPYWLCDSQGEVGDLIPEWVSVLDSDYIIWECVYLSQWNIYRWLPKDIRNAEEDYHNFQENWKRFFAGEVWQGIVDGGIGLIDADGDWTNDNIDSVAAFNLRGPSGSRIYRTLGARIIVTKLTASGWSACSDTGWKTSNPDVSAFSIKLQYPNGPKCGQGDYRMQAAGRFLSVSTGQWVTTGWVYTPSIFAGPRPPTLANAAERRQVQRLVRPG